MNSTTTRSALDRAEALLTELDAMRPLDADRLGAAMQRLRIEWTYHSNAIEGNSLDYGETRALLMHGVTAAGKPLKDHLDITGHRQALDYLEGVVQDGETLTLTGIREMHKLLLGEPYQADAQAPDGQRVRRTITPGEFKTQPNHVVTATGETHYYARPEEVASMMQDLVDDDRGASEQHPVVFAADVHHRFAAIHPFDDGNGRMARLLMNLVLMRAGYPPAVIRQENRPAYYGALAAADGGDLAPFVRFVAEELSATLELYLRALRGEPDPDVFSRRLGILKREIETRGVLPGRSIGALRQIAECFVDPFQKRLQEGTTELGKLYRIFRVSASYTQGGLQLPVKGSMAGAISGYDWSEFEWVLDFRNHLVNSDESVSRIVKGTAFIDRVEVVAGIRENKSVITYDTQSSIGPLDLADKLLVEILEASERVAKDAWGL